MKFIKPITITDSILTSSNVPEAVVTAWNSGTTYADGDRAGTAIVNGEAQSVYESIQSGNTNHALTDTDWWRFIGLVYPAYSGAVTYDTGDIVSDLTNHLLYRSKTSGNTGNALTSDTHWERIGRTNLYAAFDEIVQTQTSIGGNIEHVLEPAAFANSLALINLDASSVDLIITSSADGEVYNQEFVLTSYSGIQDWYAYFFTPIDRITDLVITDLPPYLDAEYELFINNDAGNAAVGEIVFGNFFDIGESLNGASFGIVDYSVKTTDTDTGEITVEVRSYAKRAQVDVLCETMRMEFINQALTEILNVPAVWVANESNAGTVIFGYYKEFDLVFSDYRSTMCSLQIEGLT